MESLKFKQPAQGVIFKEYLHALDQAQERVKRLEREIAELAKHSKQAPVINAIQSLRGVALITAATVVAEAGDITRFQFAKQIMSYTGVVPSEYSSGPKQRQGAITKTGNSHLRRVIVEAAWHYRRLPRVGAALAKRQQGQSEKIKDISWKAQHRLNLKFRRMVAKGKPSQVAVVAVARELLGFIWAIAREVAKQE